MSAQEFEDLCRAKSEAWKAWCRKLYGPMDKLPPVTPTLPPPPKTY